MGKKDMIEEEICKQSGLMSVLIFLMDHDGCNQRTIIQNTKASPQTIYRIQNILQKYGLVRMERITIYNQNLFFITEKGRRLGELFKQILAIIS